MSLQSLPLHCRPETRQCSQALLSPATYANAPVAKENFFEPAEVHSECRLPTPNLILNADWWPDWQSLLLLPENLLLFP
jgi:hypothetical protein